MSAASVLTCALLRGAQQFLLSSLPSCLNIDDTVAAIFIWLLSRPLEILGFTKLRALCLHSRYISPVIHNLSKRSLHVPFPIARTSNMNWSTTVYTSLSSDTEPSIVITFESAKYIINAGENTTRAILQSRRGWKKVKALFLTRLGTQRSSGVPGVLPLSVPSIPNVVRF